MNRRWVSPKQLLEQARRVRAPVLEILTDVPDEMPDMMAPPPGMARRRRRQPRETSADPAAARAQSAMRVRSAIPSVVSPGRFGEFEHDEPSLASKARPDLGAAQERHQKFFDAYNHREAKTDHVAHVDGSANNVHHGRLASGDGFVLKPLEHAGAGHGLTPDDVKEKEKWMADRWGSRHDAAYAVAAAMGSHHMIAPGFVGKAHGDDRISKNIERPAPPEEGAHPLSQINTVAAHMGRDSHIQQFADGTKPLLMLDDAAKEKVDGEHRLHGLIHHLLFSNADGHRGNVLIHETGHPVLIDHDLTLQSGHQPKADRYIRNVVSPFAPGGDLDYRSKMEEVGKNFPPRIKKTIEWLASGKADKELGLHEHDTAHLRGNAQDLLRYGLEGMMQRRNVKHRREHTKTPPEKTGQGGE